MFDSAAIEVAIGLIFLYFVFSMVCSKINEHVAGAFRWRARGLENALCKLLNPGAAGGTTPVPGSPVSAAAFFEHPTVKALVDPGRRRPLITRLVSQERIQAQVPSYLSSGTFATVVTSLLGTQATNLPNAVSALPDDHPLKQPLQEMLTRAGGDIDRFRASVERFFDDAMDRVSGWYKRQVQKFLAIYAIVVAVLFNVDTVAIARTLWSDPTARAAAVELAENVTTTTATTTPVEPDPGTTATTTTRFDLDQQLDEIREQTRLPLGWRSPPWEDFDERKERAPLKAAGLLITVLALTLGAPFWFDLLNKVSQLRSAGKKPDKAAAAAGT